MQSVLPMNPGHPLRNVTGLARQIALPGEHSPLRFPSFPALERTAVIGFNQPASMTVNTGASAVNSLTLFRQATWPLWGTASTHWFTLVNYFSNAGASQAAAPNTEETVDIAPTIQSWTTTNVTASVANIGVAVTGNPHPFAWPVLGRDADLSGPEFTYIPPGMAWLIILAFPAPSAAINATVSIEVWSTPGEVRSTASANIAVATNNTGGAVAVAAAATGQWVRPSQVSLAFSGTGSVVQFPTVAIAVASAAITYTPSNSTMGTLAGNLATAVASEIPLVQPSEFLNSSLPWYSARVTASAVLGTNVTQVLNKGGTVLGGRVNPRVQNSWVTNSSYIAGLHPAEKAYLPLESGVYTYCPPSTDLVFFADYTLNTSNGAAAAPVFALNNDAFYNKMFIVAGTAAETMALTATWHMEFRTSSALFQIGLSAMTLESLHTAQLVLAENGFFFENPEHDRLLSRVIATAKKYAPQVVGVINPQAGRLLQSVVSRLGNQKAVKPKDGPSKPPTTTAAKSGMTPKGKKEGKGKQGKKPKGK